MVTASILLVDGWRFREVPPATEQAMTEISWLPAEVPGHVHLDLMRAGVIPDPFNRLNERTVAWVDEKDWVYEAVFHLDVPVAELTYLRFNGLDTVAEICLNGELLGKTDNMFIPHEFAVGDKLRVGAGVEGENTLQVTFRSALKTGLDRRDAWDAAGNDTMPAHWNAWSSRSFVRKAQYMYGWDWGPVLISCGIWQQVELVQVPTARIVDYRYTPTFHADGSATVTVETTVERAGASTPLTLAVAIGESTTGDDFGVDVSCSSALAMVDGETTASCSVVIPNARRWWPTGTGDAHLYGLRLTVEGPGGSVDVLRSKIGLREVELVTEPDADGNGEGFLFRVNGQDIFIKGANWIPDDSFPSRIHTSTIDGVDKVEHQIRLAVDAGYNMLRVWGGGLYESKRFYELCDELGLMVWQDFAYGCAYYPDRDEYVDAARVEAVSAVRRIRNHPSLALWCGNNENDSMYHDGWYHLRPSRFIGEALYHDVLPAVVAAEDPSTPYRPSSPFGGKDPGSQDVGDRHNWNVWHGVGDWKHYLEDRSRFASEFGFAASCGLNAWDTCLVEQDRHAHSAAARWHDKTRKGYDMYLGLVALHFDMPETIEDLVYYTQVNQAEAMKCGIEHYRRLKGRCWGVLFWQLNDCWPVQSWAAIDSLGEPKAAFYESRRFFSPVLVSMTRVDGGVEAHVTSDLMERVSGNVTLSIRTFDGAVLASTTVAVVVEANGSVLAGKLDLATSTGRETETYVYAEFEPHQPNVAAQRFGLTNFQFLSDQKDWKLQSTNTNGRSAGSTGRLVVDIDDRGEHFEVRLSASTFTPYVWLHIACPAGYLPAVLSDNFVHVQAGKPVAISVRKTSWLSTERDLREHLSIRALGMSGFARSLETRAIEPRVLRPTT